MEKASILILCCKLKITKSLEYHFKTLKKSQVFLLLIDTNTSIFRTAQFIFFSAQYHYFFMLLIFLIVCKTYFVQCGLSIVKTIK